MLGPPPVTKFSPPRLPSTLVHRDALVERLEVATAPVTLVTGFAGAGKTVLLTEWIDAHPERAVAWLSCDSWDGDAQRFWTSVVTALRQLAAEVGADALDWIGIDGDATVDFVASLVNDLNAVVEPTVLVIDDLHVVPPSAMRGLSEFLERLPPRVRVVIGSRSDPSIPLHRWRVSDRLTELRDADLRLGIHEVDAMLHAFGVELAADHVKALTTRTEGWAAGVQLAALSLRGRDDAAEFVRRFAGNERNIADFLVGEVLERQADDVVAFLMATSIVDYFDAELCEYLTGRDDAASMLRAAEAAGLFLVPLDNERRSYRFHQLFRDLLRAELHTADRNRAAALHRRAARWYEDRGELTAAMQHSMSGGDVQHAFEVLHEHLLEAYYAPTSRDLGMWLDDLPVEAVAQERGRILDFGVGLALAGRIEAAGFWLQRARHAATIGPPVDDLFEARREAGYALFQALRGDAEPAIASASRALELVPRGTDATVDAVPLILLRALLWLDDLDSARRVYEEALPGWTDPATLVILQGAASRIECEAGNLRLATEYANRALADGDRVGVQDHPAAADTGLTLALLALEHNEFDDAERGFDQALRLAEPVRPPFVLLALLGLARVWHARGEWGQASAAIERAREVLPFGVRSPLQHHVNALEADFALREGDLGRAKRLVAPLPEGPRRALIDARYLLAAEEVSSARACLQRIRLQTLTPRQDIECTLVEAWVAAESDDDARSFLGRAVEIARPEGFVRTLVAADPKVTKLLADFLLRSPRDRYSDTLMTAIDRAVPRSVSRQTSTLDALSDRERAVLRYLPTRMTAREIANELFISMNTLKTHLKSIYRKLDATSRTEAVAHAGAQGLLPAT